MLRLILFFSFLTVIFTVYPLLKYLLVKQNSISRLKRYTSMEEIREEKKKSAKKDYKAGLSFMSRGVAGAKFLNGYKRSVQLQLTRGHVMLKAEEFITVCLIVFFLTMLLGLLLTGYLFPALLLGLIGWFVPSFVLKSKIKKRIKFLNEQLGDAIVLISNSLKAGYSFFQSVDIVAREMNGPIAEEFMLMQKEINLGQTTERALENLVSRVSSDDLELVVTAVQIQRQVGGNLAEVLDNISSTIRDRVKIKGDVRTVTAQGRMSGLIIALLPLVLGLLVFLINPEHMSILFTHPLGIGILVYSVITELVGVYFINKIVKIEV